MPRPRKRRRVPGSGSKSRYKAELVPQVEKLAAEGWLQREMMEFFGISETTWKRWKREHPELRAAVERGNKAPDDHVEASLYHRARGYSHAEERMFFDSKSGKVHRATTVKHYPPDTQAAMFWLTNRRPEQWKHKTETAHLGKLSLEELVGGVAQTPPKGEEQPAEPPKPVEH